MPRKLPEPHTRLEVSEPCTVEWDSMAGNERVRFCSHCRLHVHNLSEFTPAKAAELAMRSGGRLCLRIARRPDGTPLTKTFSEPFHQIRRRVSRLAAGAFGAAVTLASAAASHAQTPAAPAPEAARSAAARDEAARDAAREGSPGSLVGTVLDAHGAIIPGASVTLSNTQTGVVRNAATDDEGAYHFEGLETGTFTLKFEKEGFTAHVQTDVSVQSAKAQRSDATLTSEEVMIVSGIVMVITVPEEPLVKAAYSNDLEGLRKVLLFDNPDVDVVDKAVGLTALAQAFSNGNRNIVRELLGRGAKVNVRLSYRQTALMRLDERTTVEIVRDLLDAGAKVNLRDEDGNTALINAAGLGKTDIVEALLKAGARANAKNKQGTTALMLAAGAGATESVRALLIAGADVNARGEGGETALTRAESNGHEETADLLKSYGAVSDAPANGGAESEESPGQP